MTRRKSRRIRSLANPGPPRKKTLFDYVPVKFLGILLIGTAIGVLYGDLIKGHYRHQYNLLIHGTPDYCLPYANFSQIFAKIKAVLKNQDDILGSIEEELQTTTTLYKSFAIVGSSGTGKSLFTQSFQNSFPWEESNHAFDCSKDTYKSNEDKQKDLFNLLTALNKCGRNLIVIDNLQVDDIDIVQEFNDRARDAAVEKMYNLIVFYVFNIKSYTEEHLMTYSKQIEAYQRLKNMKVVQFNRFDGNHVRDCVRIEAEYIKRQLTEEEIDEIVTQIDPIRSGCKGVYSKVRLLLYSTNPLG